MHCDGARRKAYKLKKALAQVEKERDELRVEVAAVVAGVQAERDALKAECAVLSGRIDFENLVVVDGDPSSIASQRACCNAFPLTT